MELRERLEREAILFVIFGFIWRGGIFVLRHAGVEITWTISIGILVILACIYIIIWAFLSPEKSEKR